MNPELENALEDCLERMARGASTMDECLARYPQHIPELRPLLLAASRLEQVRAFQPSKTFKMHGRAQLLNHMEAHPHRGWFSWLPGVAARPYRLAFTLVSLLFIFLVAATTVAQAALPGDFLYGWKRASEQVWRELQPDPLSADLALSERRAQELAGVTGDVEAEQQARQEYQESLAVLAGYTDPIAQPVIYQQLAGQRLTLNQANIDVPELDRLLATLATEQPLPPSTVPAPLLTTPEVPETPGLETTPPPLPSVTVPTETPVNTPIPDNGLPIPGVTPPPLPTELSPIPELPPLSTLPPILP